MIFNFYLKEQNKSKREIDSVQLNIYFIDLLISVIDITSEMIISRYSYLRFFFFKWMKIKPIYKI